jgi:hypothetical protein
MSSSASPIARFYQFVPSVRPPQRADRSACGTLPTRAFRYCEAATSATSYGWWVFPPLDMQVLWDGSDLFWHHDGAEDWLPLMPSAQFPHFVETFNAAAPSDIAGCSPPFLTALPEPGALQIWTGLFVRTAPNWNLLVRAPANLPTSGGFAVYEGIIESDRVFLPVFANLRFTRSHSPIRFRPDFPLLQVQPIPSHAYSDATLGAMTVVPDMAAFAPQDWDDYRSAIVEPNRNQDRPFGAYAAASRKQKRGGSCPFHVA